MADNKEMINTEDVYDFDEEERAFEAEHQKIATEAAYAAIADKLINEPEYRDQFAADIAEELRRQGKTPDEIRKFLLAFADGIREEYREFLRSRSSK